MKAKGHSFLRISAYFKRGPTGPLMGNQGSTSVYFPLRPASGRLPQLGGAWSKSKSDNGRLPYKNTTMEYMNFLKLLTLFGCLVTIAAHAEDNVTNGTVVYVSPDASATNGMPGDPDHPYNDPEVANSVAASGGSLIFLPGTYNLFKTIPLLNHENVFISQGANLINWVIATNGGTGPLFLITNNVKITIDGTISDAYAPGNPIEQCAIGLFEFTPKERDIGRHQYSDHRERVHLWRVRMHQL